MDFVFRLTFLRFTGQHQDQSPGKTTSVRFNTVDRTEEVFRNLDKVCEKGQYSIFFLKAYVHHVYVFVVKTTLFRTHSFGISSLILKVFFKTKTAQKLNRMCSDHSSWCCYFVVIQSASFVQDTCECQST